MKVLFVSSGNIKNGIGTVVGNQGKSLEKINVDLSYFLIFGKGFWGYLQNVRRLKDVLNKEKYDVIHAHYGLCAWIAYLAKGKEKLVVSFMGSDVIVKKDEEKYFLLKFMQRLNFWLAKKCDLVIVKSTEMSSNLPSPIDHRVIPNGVNTDLFKELNRHDCRKRLGWDERDFVALFLANPDRIEKNFKLANAGFNLFKNKQDNAKLLVKYDIKNEDLPLYYNAADVMLLTSLYEGSPNVVKEAMSCNCPVISADVGDVKWLLKDSDGSFVIQSDEKSLSDALQKVLENGREGINTRDKIEKLNLGEKQIAHRLLKEYESLFN